MIERDAKVIEWVTGRKGTVHNNIDGVVTLTLEGDTAPVKRPVSKVEVR